MNKYYFTWTASTKKNRDVQLVYAASEKEAFEKMQNVYGKRFTECFTEIHTNREDISCKLIDLKPLYASEKGMKLGEMFAWTNRFNNIIEVSGPSKTGRLNNLMDDLDRACDLVADKFAKQLYMRAGEELSESIKGA